MIVIVDYGMGNIMSVAKAIRWLGRKVEVTDSPKVVKKAEKIILPGVGHFSRAMKELKKRHLLDIFKDKIEEKTPFLGICLGMQLLFKYSEEAKNLHGLGIIEGEVKKFPFSHLTIPHMGWNKVYINYNHSDIKRSAPSLLKSIPNQSYFYFAHSYYCRVEDKSCILTTTLYGIKFVSSFHRDNIWGVQFHPEKSQRLGLKLLDNFLKLR